MLVAVLVFEVLNGCASSYFGPFICVADLSSRRVLPAATASCSLQFTVPLLAAKHFRLLALRRGTACHRRLRQHRLWRHSALDSRRFCFL